MGKTSTRDYAHHCATKEVILADLDDEERYVRRELRGEDYEPETGTGIDLTGMSMRSRIVSGWPGLEVRAYDQWMHAMRLLRMDRPSPDILYCLFEGIPKVV